MKIYPGRFTNIGLILVLILSISATVNADLIAISGAGQTDSILYKIDPTTGAATQLGDTGLNHFTGLAVHPTSGVLFGHRNLRFTDLGELYTLNIGTAFPTFIGTTGISASDLTFADDGTLYGWMELHDGRFGMDVDDLVTFSQSTGVVTRVGEAGSDSNRSGLAFDSNGALHLKVGAVSQADGMPRMFTVNPATGVTTSGQALTGNPTNTLDFDENDVAYSVERRFDVSNAYLGTFLQTIDIQTGVVTDVARIQTSANISPHISAIAFTSFEVSAVPEPSTYALFSCVMLGMIGVLGRREMARRQALFPLPQNRRN